MRVAGHGLVREGLPAEEPQCDECRWTSSSWQWYRLPDGREVRLHMLHREGHAVCECGWFGPHRSTSRKRQADHRVHKEEVAV